MKVLIVEKNAKVGGYCTSFERNGFLFDACAHSLGSCRKEGNITKMLEELGIKNKISIKRHDPSDIIITPHHKISFHSDLKKTIEGFSKNFPHEAANINRFFRSIVNSSDLSLLALRKKTFGRILNENFKDNRLKAILSFPVLGNAGVNPSFASAFSSMMLYREFMLDGGYYPGNSMQDLPDVLTVRFKELGGEVKLSSMVNNILVEENVAKRILLDNKDSFSAKHLVSACDAVQTFTELLGARALPKGFVKRLSKMKTSLSMLILYIGIDKHLKIGLPECTNVWFLPHYNIKKLYFGASRRTKKNLAEFMVRILPGKKNFVVFVNANFGDRKYWESNKNQKEIADNLIKKVDKLIPTFSSHVIFKEIATPYALYNWTMNNQGASYGWSAIPKQLMLSEFYCAQPIKNFYLTGHWNTIAHSIRGVIFSGKHTSAMITRK
jgi:phytoene dehydrogenase-like protein